MSQLHQLSQRANIETFSYRGKDIVLYDDHRTILNIIFEANKLNIFSETPNLIYFDRHDDACKSFIKSEILEKIGVSSLDNATSKQFWSFTEFDLSYLDDDWLLAGMELGLIKDAVLIGQEENHNIQNLKNKYSSENGMVHELFSIPHLSSSLNNRGCLGDAIIKESYFKNVREIVQFNHDRFNDEEVKPFILDFDLDCFTSISRNKTHAWLEYIFTQEFYINTTVRYFMQSLIERASFITICREAKCCGGLGESNKILNYLDRYLFDGNLNTDAMC